MPNTLLASACPAPIVPTAITYATDNVPPTSMAISSNSRGAIVTAFMNRDLARLDYLSRFASGMYCIGEGMAISAGAGLVMNIAAGVLVVDGLLWEMAADTVTLPANEARVWIWAKRSAPTSTNPASIVYDYSVTTAPPSGGLVLLGNCVTGASAITPASEDTSGVIYSKGGQHWRYTGDTGGPSDTPNGGLRFYSQSGGGDWLWDGTRWKPAGQTYVAIGGAKSDANYTLSQSEWLCESIRAGWTGFTAQRNIVVPSVAGQQWFYTNKTGQANQLIAATGTGIVIANNRTALVRFDGTNVVRITTDTAESP